MSWNDRKPGWLGRSRKTSLPRETVPVPNYPVFSPAAAADVLRVYRSTVGYWLAAGKLSSYRDNLGTRYVPREELLRFIRDYLRQDPS